MHYIYKKIPKDGRKRMELEQIINKLQGDLPKVIKFFMTALNSLQDLIYLVEVKNNQCKYLFANQAGLTILDADERLYGKTFEEVLQPEEIEFIAHQYLKAYSSRKVVTFEDQIIRPNGNIMINETVLTPFIDKEDVYIIAVVRDISDKSNQLKELQQSRNRLEEKEQLLASLLDHNEDAIFMLDTDGYFLEVNNATENITGYRNEEMMGMNFSQLMPTKELERVQGLFHKAVEGVPVRYETSIYHKVGYEVFLNVKNIPIVIEEKIKGVYGIAKDITAEKKASEELSLLKSRLESFINDSTDSISMTDLEGKVIFINDAFTKVYGFTEQEVIGKEPPIIPNWLKKETTSLNEQVLLGKKMQGIHVKRQKKTGELLDMSISLSPIYNELGQIEGISGISRDITEEKKMEMEIMNTKEELELVWHNTSDALFMIGQNGRILKANPAFEEMLGWTAEEMNNLPVSPIHPEFHLKQLDDFITTLRMGEQIPHFETQRKHKNGTTIDVVAAYRPINKGNIVAVGTYRDVTEYIKILKEIKEKEEKFRNIAKASPEAIIVYTEGKITFINERALSLLKAKSQSQAIGKSILDFVYPSDRKQVEERMRDAIYKEKKEEFIEERLLNFEGEIIYAETAFAPINDGGKVSVVIMIRDVTTKKRAEKATSESEERFRIIAEHSMDIIKVLDPQGKIIYASPAIEKILGYPVRKMIGKPFYTTIHSDDMEKARNEFKEMLKTKKYIQINLRRIHQDGHYIWLNTDFVPVLNPEGEVEKIVAISNDITELRKKEKKLAKMAYSDHLTGLPNRRKFMECLQQAIYTSERTGKVTALMVLDCDKFKQINDNFGHDTGDEVIKEFAKRVRTSIRKMDTLSRVGGDEFTIVLPELSHEQDADAISKRIFEEVRKPMYIKGKKLQITVSIGISFYPTNTSNMEELFKEADIALYKAKESGRNKCCFSWKQ